MSSRHIVRRLALMMAAIAVAPTGHSQATYHVLDVPRDIGLGSAPVSGSWNLLSCTSSTTCPTTIVVMPSTSGNPRDCRFTSVPDIIDVKATSSRIDWTLQTTSDKRYTFGWRLNNGTELREGVRIRDSNVHDEDDHDPNQAGPKLSDAFDAFSRTSDTAGYTGLKAAELRKPLMHRMFFYRIHVDQTDADGSNLVHCRPYGPMIINRG